MSLVKNVVIVGGGTAGWLAAAAFSNQLGRQLNITLIESDQIPTVGVGEATIPSMAIFHKLIGIDEQEFMREVSATFKLGIQFNNWGDKGKSYFHSFGRMGKEFWAGEFQHFWLASLDRGFKSKFGDFSFEQGAALNGKFGFNTDPRVNYAYHLDAGKYAKFLRKKSESAGVKRIEGTVVEVVKDSEKGNLSAVKLKSGRVVDGDFFIDCSGFRGLLIEGALHTGYDDWSHWLVSDSAVAVQTTSVEDAVPYTKSTAFESGWQWKIPLQNRVGNGLVYCNRYISDDEALSLLRKHLEGDELTEPKIIRYKVGKRRKIWNKNCVALGLASGFIEPLESTSIHLVTSTVLRFMRLFPFNGISDAARDEFNKQVDYDLKCIRDFIILHYKQTNRRDSEMWRYCADMDIPESLRHRMELFRETGRVFKADFDLFLVDSWTQVMIGQGILPKQYHRFVDDLNDAQLEKYLNGIKSSIELGVSRLPGHREFVESYCEETV